MSEDNLEFLFGIEVNQPEGLDWFTLSSAAPLVFDDLYITTTPSAVSEPASMILFGTGLVGAAMRKRFSV